MLTARIWSILKSSALWLSCQSAFLLLFRDPLISSIDDVLILILGFGAAREIIPSCLGGCRLNIFLKCSA